MLGWRRGEEEKGTKWQGLQDRSKVIVEPVFVIVYGAQESIPRKRFRQPMQPGKQSCTGPPGWESIPMLLKRFANTGSEPHFVQLCTTIPEAGVLVRKLSQLTPLSKAKQVNPRYFILLCEISCELASCVHRPIMDCRVQDSRLRTNQTLVSFTLAGLAQLSRLSSISLKLPPLHFEAFTFSNIHYSTTFMLVQKLIYCTH